ncbi:4Fe-4S dicluster domain-containing protein [Pseudodesulfovibrio sediminis]|uniref:Hydrogenase n=1 Tax=Pseudodesulfovibrio sediminis TaxID=2810563 RepID=A0ABM7P9I7_9BACT|nr:4Fe-4S dicluster domain-containing protein [Pseudodesulfovibrio sediminis]BCS89777.1 hydrogenase [Pseudodesulfovibrio sediminis]
MAAKFLATDQLVPWLAELNGKYRTLVPMREGDAVVFSPFQESVAPVLEVRPTAAPRGSVFPQCDPLLTFEYKKDPEQPAKVMVEVTERRDDTPAVVVGGRPCDAAGFNTFDRVYETDTIKDLNYLARRENTLFVSLICTKPATTCFCNWVGGGPADPVGSDVQMIPVNGGWLLESVTDRGEAMLNEGSLPDGADKSAEAGSVKDAANAAMGEAQDVSAAKDKLLELFDDADFWEAQSAKCISCGTCTYLCPTCYCFNITDEKFGMKGVRLRTWDNCMSSQFTMEASGHNPRPTKAHRLKNRVGHKFSYYPSLHGDNIACVGCGRCIKSCPASVDIRAIVLNAIAAPAPQEG